ncbi:hypothetical protein [Spirillospora sp. CA-128828]|uniref:hypothetical protein n=1 Tax=Spirillospora sp. CA-128828 TaxID=3240033 RepID=UPI003D8FD59B
MGKAQLPARKSCLADHLAGIDFDPAQLFAAVLRSIASALADVLIDRDADRAARSSAPARSTPEQTAQERTQFGSAVQSPINSPARRRPSRAARLPVATANLAPFEPEAINR